MVNARIKKYTLPLHINSMDGRMLRMPASKGKNRQILLLYGHHASIERIAGLAEVFSDYGAVTVPDLPGLGGMDSFYKIGQEPNLDNYADYIASIIKLYYKRRRLTIIAMSFAVPIIVRVMQKHPELAKKVDVFISIAGFVRADEFKLPAGQLRGLKLLARVFEKRLPAMIMTHTVLAKPVITAIYKAQSSSHAKMRDAASKVELDRRIAFEAGLWKMNDVRTRMHTMTTMFTLDLCGQTVANGPRVYHVTASNDRYFDNDVVVEHLRVIFKSVTEIPSEMPNHAPSIMASADEARLYVPKAVRDIL